MTDELRGALVSFEAATPPEWPAAVETYARILAKEAAYFAEFNRHFPAGSVKNDFRFPVVRLALDRARLGLTIRFAARLFLEPTLILAGDVTDEDREFATFWHRSGGDIFQAYWTIVTDLLIAGQPAAPGLKDHLAQLGKDDAAITAVHDRLVALAKKSALVDLTKPRDWTSASDY